MVTVVLKDRTHIQAHQCTPRKPLPDVAAKSCKCKTERNTRSSKLIRLPTSTSTFTFRTSASRRCTHTGTEFSLSQMLPTEDEQLLNQTSATTFWGPQVQISARRFLQVAVLRSRSRCVSSPLQSPRTNHHRVTLAGRRKHPPTTPHQYYHTLMVVVGPGSNQMLHYVCSQRRQPTNTAKANQLPTNERTNERTNEANKRSERTKRTNERRRNSKDQKDDDESQLTLISITEMATTVYYQRLLPVLYSADCVSPNKYLFLSYCDLLK